MSENWNLETVADSKPEAPPLKPEAPPLKPAKAEASPVPEIPSVLSNEYSLGKIMAMAREARGVAREQAATESHIPAYYLAMIENDDYSSIADQLYLLPFLRRYATFVGLEPEEVASRFIRDVQRADMNPGRLSEPIAMFTERKPFPWNIVLMAGAAVAVIVVGWFGYRHLAARKATPPVAPKAPAAASPATAEAQESSPTNETAPAKETAPPDNESAAPEQIPPPPAVSAPNPVGHAGHAGVPGVSAVHKPNPAKPKSH